jgi:hypothetical protein
VRKIEDAMGIATKTASPEFNGNIACSALAWPDLVLLLLAIHCTMHSGVWQCPVILSFFSNNSPPKADFRWRFNFGGKQDKKRRQVWKVYQNDTVLDRFGVFNAVFGL